MPGGLPLRDHPPSRPFSPFLSGVRGRPKVTKFFKNFDRFDCYRLENATVRPLRERLIAGQIVIAFTQSGGKGPDCYRTHRKDY